MYSDIKALDISNSFGGKAPKSRSSTDGPNPPPPPSGQKQNSTGLLYTPHAADDPHHSHRFALRIN